MKLIFSLFALFFIQFKAFSQTNNFFNYKPNSLYLGLNIGTSNTNFIATKINLDYFVNNTILGFYSNIGYSGGSTTIINSNNLYTDVGLFFSLHKALKYKRYNVIFPIGFTYNYETIKIVKNDFIFNNNFGFSLNIKFNYFFTDKNTIGITFDNNFYVNTNYNPVKNNIYITYQFVF